MGKTMDAALSFFPDAPDPAIAKAWLSWADADHMRRRLADLDVKVTGTAGTCRMDAPSAEAWIAEQAEFSPGPIGLLHPFGDKPEVRRQTLAAMARNIAPHHKDDAMRFGYARILIEH